MDKLPDSLLLEILSRVDDSADVARCRVASKAFITVFPGLRSINLYSGNNNNLRSRDMNSFRKVFLDLLTKQETVESVSIDVILSEDFFKEWLPRVSVSLKSLSISGGFYLHSWQLGSTVFRLISAYCHNLVTLTLRSAVLRTYYLKPMPTLTSLTLDYIDLGDEEVNELNTFFPNLQVLNMIDVTGLKNPKIRLLNLKTCHYYNVKCIRPFNLALITPNLITLKIECFKSGAIHLEAPLLSNIHLSICCFVHPAIFVETFENLKTLLLDSPFIDSILSEFPITKTLETLSLCNKVEARRYVPYLTLSLGKVFTVFPNVSSLCIHSIAWSEVEACLKKKGVEIFGGGKGLKTIRAYLMLDDPSLTFRSIACVLDQCVCLSEVSLLIHSDVSVTVSESFMSKCMARWPGLKWRWGIWKECWEGFWITNAISK